MVETTGEEREPKGRTGEQRWADQVGRLGQEVARVPLQTAQLGTSLLRHMAEALDDFVGALLGRREPPHEGRRRGTRNL